MNRQEAKEILSLYRPGSPDDADGQFAEALEQTKQDAELREWFERSCAFQVAMREKFRQIPVPPDLRETILAGQKIIRPPWWRSPAWMAVAATIVILLGLAAFVFQPGVTDRFSNYRSRMVRTALRQYRMEIVNHDQEEIRQFMLRRGAPADYVVTNGLEQLSVTGGGILRWRSNPVSMVCFDRGDKQMLFLFVMNRSALKDAPLRSGVVAKVSNLLTASWSEGDRTYLLAGPEDSAVFRKWAGASGSP